MYYLMKAWFKKISIDQSHGVWPNLYKHFVKKIELITNMLNALFYISIFDENCFDHW